MIVKIYPIPFSERITYTHCLNLSCKSEICMMMFWCDWKELELNSIKALLFVHCKKIKNSFKLAFFPEPFWYSLRIVGKSACSCGTVQAEPGPCVCSFLTYLAAPETHMWPFLRLVLLVPVPLSWNLEGLWEEMEMSVTFRERPQNVHLCSSPVSSVSNLVPLAAALFSWRVQSSPND